MIALRGSLASLSAEQRALLGGKGVGFGVQRRQAFGRAAGQPLLANAGPIAFTLAASEALDPATVDASDFDVANGTASVVCSGSACAISVTPAGQGVVSIAPSASFSVADLAGNTTATADGSDRSVTYDSVEIGRAHV